MTKRIGCLHAHHSNIRYLEAAFAPYDVQLVHFVDPGLIHQAGTGNLGAAAARQKVREHLQWIAASGVAAIIITCTQYIATLGDDAPVSLPLIKLDEPFFDHLCQQAQPCTLLFTNPATVAGTVSRLQAHAARKQVSLQVEPQVLVGTFELVMQGRNADYQAAVSAGLRELAATQPHRRLAVAQLSMVDAAEEVAQALGLSIAHPLEALRQSVASQLHVRPTS